MPVDLLLENDFDLKIVDGDFVIGESTRQHQQLLLLVQKGELKEFPQRGVGIRSWVLDENPGDLNTEIKREFEADGMRILRVQIAGSSIQTEAVYE